MKTECVCKKSLECNAKRHWPIYDAFTKHMLNGKDYGTVTYSTKNGYIRTNFKPCYALLKSKGVTPWIQKGKALSALSVRVEYQKQGKLETVFFWSAN